jgi:hypothetical protein
MMPHEGAQNVALLWKRGKFIYLFFSITSSFVG